MSPERLCDACARRPRGIDGHEDLHHRGNNVFRCEACRADWARSYVGAGEFVWERQEARDSEAAE